MISLSDQHFNERLEAIDHGEELPGGLASEDAADLSLARRLLALRAEPSPRLVAQVEQVIAEPPPRQTHWLDTLKRRIPMFSARAPVWKRVAWSLAALVLVFGFTMAVFPSARAAVLDIIRTIGGIKVVEMDHFPESPEDRQGGWLTVIFWDDLSDVQPPEIREPTLTTPLAEAQAALPFSLTLPTWAPDGFTLKDEARIWLPGEGNAKTCVGLTWENAANGGGFFMSILQAADDDYEHLLLVGLDSVEEVQVNGQPAALVRGGWDAQSKQYVMPDLLQLQWERNGLIYCLAGQEGLVSAADLIRVAESIP